MKTLKPQRLGVLTRTFENDGKCFFVPTVLVGFAFDQPNVPIHEAALWKALAAELGEGEALDEAMVKPRGEVLVTGSAYPPGGEPGIGCAVRLTMGDIDKRLYAVGDREWGATGPTEPKPFTKMPVSWQRAFGGEANALNPLGIGANTTTDDDGNKYFPLPNIEDPKALIKSRGDKPSPVGLGPIDARSTVRRERAGTYDKKWLEAVFPAFPEDFDWEFFNVAPRDQWLDGFFTGGESFALENMHPDAAELQGRTPELTARCFITRTGESGEKEFREISTKLDTVHLFPNIKLGVAFYRGATEVSEDDAADVLELLIACESKAQPKADSHYREALDNRLDKEKSPLFYLRDSDLLPPLPEGLDVMGLDEASDLPELLSIDNLLAKNLRKKAELELENLRDICRQHDVDPDEHLPKALPEPVEERPDLEHLDTYIDDKKKEVDEERAAAEERQQELLAEARRMCAENNIDFDEVIAAGKRDGAGPPTFSAEGELQKLRDMKELAENAGASLSVVDAQLADPELLAKLKAAEAQLREAYRRNAHELPAADRLDAETSAPLAVRLNAAVTSGESLDSCDYTGANLQKILLDGASLRGIFLEGADLTGASLRGVDLSHAVLVRADLSGANLAGAKLVGANLAGARLEGTDLSGCDLSSANLTQATLVDTRLDGATLQQAFLFGAKIKGGSFTGIMAKKLFFHELDLSGIDLSGAQLPECIFIETKIEDAAFRGAVLEGACFVTVNADRTNFEDARCSNMRVVHGSSLAGANFKNADLTGANLRETNMRGVNLQNAQARGVDLSGCDLEGGALEMLVAPDALFVRANLKQAKLRRADLMQSILQKANIEGADFSGANLFRGDFAKIRGDKETSFEGANMKFIRFVDREQHG
jgi:uncharacterized protein YjbI with pentapeptide repeats